MRLSKKEFVVKLPFLIKNIDELGLVVLTRSKLLKANLNQIYKIAALSPAKLKIAPGSNQYILSKTSMKEIASVLEEMGLMHNMEFAAEELALLAVATPEIAARLPVLLLGLDDCEMSTHLWTCLWNHNSYTDDAEYVRRITGRIRCLGDLAQKKSQELLRIARLGTKTLIEIINLLQSTGLHSEMEITDTERSFIDYYHSDTKWRKFPVPYLTDKYVKVGR